MRLRGKLGRKGKLTNEQLVKLLIILVSVALVMFFLLRIKDIVTKNADGECAAEVHKAHLVNTVYSRSFAIDIENCQTRYLTVENDKLGADKEAAAKRILADEMLQCWREWGKGELTLFKDTGEYCHVCSVVTFEDTYTLKNFDVYLQNTTIPGRKANYTEELIGYKDGSDIRVEKFTQTGYSAVTDKPYMVVFKYGKYKDTHNIYEKIFGENTATPVFGSVVAGTAGATLAALVGAPVVIPAAVGGALVTFFIHQTTDNFYVLSGTYLIPQTPEQLEKHGCERAATVTRSP